MVKVTTHYVRSTNFAIMVITMVAMTAILWGTLYVVLAAAESAKADNRSYLLGLAYVTVGALALTSLVFAWIVIRHIASRLKQPSEAIKPAEHVDAWTEAGRRLDPKDAPPVEPYETSED